MNRSKWIYPLYNILHPIEGVEEMHYYKKHSIVAATVIFFFYMFSDVFRIWFLGPQFDITSTDDIYLLRIFAVKSVPIVLWSISNWGFCILNDGKAKFTEIITITVYSLLPYTITHYLYTVFSNFLLREEKIFLEWLVLIGIALSITLLVTQLMNYQEYTFGKVLWLSFLTVLGMAIIIFICFLLFALIQQIITTVFTIYTEASLRF